MARPDDPRDRAPDGDERDEASTTGSTPASVTDPEVTGESALSPMMAAVGPDAKAAAQVAKRSVVPALPVFRVAIAVRAALAAMAAWLDANQMGGDLTDYAYAAPLGAFVATGTASSRASRC